MFRQNGGLDLNTTFFKKRAIFRPSATFTGGLSIAINVPYIERQILNIEFGDRVDGIITYPGLDETITFTDRRVNDSSNIVISGIEKIPEIVQVILVPRKLGINIKSEFYDISDQFLFSSVIQKSKIISGGRGGSVAFTIRQNQVRWLDINVGEEMNFYMVRLDDDRIISIDRIRPFRGEIISDNVVTIPSKLASRRNIEEGQIYQIVGRFPR